MAFLDFLRAKTERPNILRQPDMKYAVEGFYPIAMMRHHGVEIDLGKIAVAKGHQLMKDGYSDHEFTSAQWGGVIAIGAELGIIRTSLETYEETVVSMGSSPDKLSNIPEANKWKLASASYINLMLNESPWDYERFLKIVYE